MIQINGIDILDGSEPTQAGVDLMRRVHEAMDMGCWHEIRKVNHASECVLCHAVSYSGNLSNPSYLTSLDAWRPVWDKLGKIILTYVHVLEGIPDSQDIHIQGLNSLAHRRVIPVLAHPHHHLEALASVLEVECDKCLGTKEQPCATCSMTAPHCGGYNCNCEHCESFGKRTILDMWSAEHGIKS